MAASSAEARVDVTDVPAGNDDAGAARRPRPSRMPIRPHEEAYENFIRLTTWSTIGVIAVLVLLALFLV